MFNFRWKWIGYHTYSNLFTVVLCLIIVWIASLNLGIVFPANTIIIMSLSASVIAIILGLVFGFQFSKNLRNKLDEISIGVKTLAYGNLNFRLPFTEDKDVGEIAFAFNEMANRLDEQVTALQKLAQENETLIQQAKSSAITQERQRLARELHDAVSQQLFAISLTSATALRVVKNQPEKAIDLLKNIELSSLKAQSEMRALLLQLRPETLQDEKLIDAINKLAEEVHAKMSIEFTLNLAEISLPIHIENHLYRIFQEALSNILRHSEASKVDIKLKTLDNKRVNLIIEDNGVGFDVSKVPKTSYGIITIKERVSELGGTVDWISIPGKGTRLEVRIPIRKEGL